MATGVFAGVTILIILAVLIWFSRRVRLRIEQTEAKLGTLHENLVEALNHDREDFLGHIRELHRASNDQRTDIQQLSDTLTRVHQDLAAQIRTEQEQLHELKESAAAEEASRRRLEEELTTLRHLLSKPPTRPAVAQSIVSGRTDADILQIAKELVIVRPLIPYPRWRFDVDWNNPDLGTQMRAAIWEHFRGRPDAEVLVIDWHLGLKLTLNLSNDVGKQLFIAGCIDPNEFAFLNKFLQDGMTFIDAGANDGLYSLFAARKVGCQGKIWAFEPSKREQQRLATNLKLNELSKHVRIFACALAEDDGTANLTVAEEEHAGHNTLGAFAYDTVQVLRTEPIQTRALDRIAEEDGLSRLDVLKIDVEGAEYRLIKGASGVLRRFRPVILLEVLDASLRAQGSNREELLSLLRSHDYRLHVFDDHTGLPIPAAAGVFGDNMLAVPAEKHLPDRVMDAVPLSTNDQSN